MHPISLKTFEHDVLHTIKRKGSQTVPAEVARDVICGALTFVLKTQHTHDLGIVCNALRAVQTEAEAGAEQSLKPSTRSRASSRIL
jgi:hypothetical protein